MGLRSVQIAPLHSANFVIIGLLLRSLWEKMEAGDYLRVTDCRQLGLT
jgi:hypothetical protein